MSLPEFVTATLLLIVVADQLQLLPATGYVAPSEDLVDSIRHLILPVATVSLILVAHVSRMVRSETIDVLNSDYVRAARLKGLPPRTVLMRHVLRNALLPTITIVALDVGYLLGGIIVVEEIFAIPGHRPAIDRRHHDARPAVDPGRGHDHGRHLRHRQHAGRHRLRRDRQAHPL